MAKLTFTPHDPNKPTTVKQEYHAAKAHEYKTKHISMKKYFIITSIINIGLIITLTTLLILHR